MKKITETKIRTKPILLVDFDGVIHSYTSPWQGVGVVADQPVPGALRWLFRVGQVFNVQIYSSRSGQPGGIEAMRRYIYDHALKEFNKSDVDVFMSVLSFPTQKSSAFLTIDDRAIQFQGRWEELEPNILLKFKPWNKR